MFKDAKEALEYLKNWLIEQGWEGPFKLVISYGLNKYCGRPAWEFDLLSPPGIFWVLNDESGEVIDLYNTVVSV